MSSQACGILSKMGRFSLVAGPFLVESGGWVSLEYNIQGEGRPTTLRRQSPSELDRLPQKADRPPPTRTQLLLWHTVNKREVRIILECILVEAIFVGQMPFKCG